MVWVDRADSQRCDRGQHKKVRHVSGGKRLAMAMTMGTKGGVQMTSNWLRMGQASSRLGSRLRGGLGSKMENRILRARQGTKDD